MKETERDNYIYQHVNLTSGEVFYIGLTNNRRRTWQGEGGGKRTRNHLWCNYVEKNGAWKAEIVAAGLTREEGEDMEVFLIAKYGRLIDGTGHLTNITAGGESYRYGRTGWTLTDEHRQKISSANKGKIRTAETRAALRKPKPPRSKEHCQALSARPVGDEQRRNMSASAKARFGRTWTGILCENNGKTYSNYRDIESDLGISSKHIPHVCAGKRSHTKGYKFKYV